MEDEEPTIPPLLLSHGYCWPNYVSEVEDDQLKVDALECKVEERLRDDRYLVRYKMASGWSDSSWLLFRMENDEWFMQRYR